MNKIYILIILFVFPILKLAGQDIGVINISSPVTGCALSNTQSVTVQIFNFGTTVSTNFNVSYRINNGAVVTETIVLGAPYTSGSTYSYTFSTTADLSAFGNYLFDAFTSLTGDANASNDTIKSYLVTSDAYSNGGNISGVDSVCSGTNSGTLNLSGHTGNVVQWEFSADSGTTWTIVNNTTTSLNFSNLISNRDYRVLVKNGTCPSVYSPVFTVTVNPPTVNGTVSSSDTVCFTGNSGTLTLSGHTGDINHWEYSENAGSSWSIIANNTTSLTFSNLTQTTTYRAQVQSGKCPYDYSSQATITVVPASEGGTVNGDTLVCSGTNNGTIELTGHVGNVTNWEYSEDQGLTWSSIGNITNSINYTNLTVETWYRANVLSCSPSDYSSILIIKTDQPSQGGEVLGSTLVCANSNNGTLTLSNYTGKVLHWEQSTDNGVTWINIPTTDPFFNYANLTQTSLYRALVQNGVCPPEYSLIAQVTVDPVTVPGTVNSSTTACITENSGNLVLVNYTGSILKWQYSIDDGNTWLDILNTSPNQTYANLSISTHYRVEVQSGNCPAAFSQAAVVTIVSASDAGVIAGDDIVCYGNNQGVINLSNFSATDITWQYSENEVTNWVNFQNLNAPSISYQNLLSKTFFRAFVNNGSCPSDTSAVVVVDLYERTVDAGKDVVIQRGESVNLVGMGGVSYMWSPDNKINNNSIPNPVVSPQTTTSYVLTITDYNGCTDSDTVVVTVKTDGELKIANLVTPNGDGYNDSWIIEPAGIQPEVLVFNSSGKEIFSSINYDNSWNGAFSGSILPDGTYYYVVKFESKVYKGALTLLGGKK